MSNFRIGPRAVIAVWLVIVLAAAAIAVFGYGLRQSNQANLGVTQTGDAPASTTVQRPPEGTVVVSIVYGSEKREWLEPLVQEFNAAGHRTAGDKAIQIEATPMGSIESVNAIIEGQIEPTVWSPASSIYIPVANEEWRKTHSSDLASGTLNDLVRSPVVIAMWRSMAEALGWPGKALGWSDIRTLAQAQEGWAAYGYPEWGAFKFGHTHPNFSNSGISSILAESYAGAAKQAGLTLEDLSNPDVRAFMSDVESSIIHYGTSTGFFGERMFERGPSYLSAAVLYENLVAAQESKRLSGASTQLPVVAIYPKEGTFWSNHPYAILNAPWVTEEQREGAKAFETFLLARPQQERAVEFGFRPADEAIPLRSPLDAEHGIDPAQPKTVLEVPPAEVTRGVEELWKQVKKPVDVLVVMDVSGSMAGEKINSARTSLVDFVGKLDNRDRVAVTIFNDQITAISPLSIVGEKRDELSRRISGVSEGGDTRLHDAVLKAYRDMEQGGDAEHIRAIIVLSDGQDTASTGTFEALMAELKASNTEGGNAIKVFTIAFGDDADVDVLKQIADATGGRQYASDPATIQQVYTEIATFF